MVLSYCEFDPPVPQRAYVCRFWRLWGSADTVSDGGDLIFPDGHCEMVVNLGGPVYQFDEGKLQVIQPRFLFTGQLTRAAVIQPSGKVNIYGVRFQPGASFCLTGIPPSEPMVDLEGVWGRAAIERWHYLAEAPNPQAVWQRMAVLLNQLIAGASMPDVRVGEAVAQISRGQGVGCLHGMTTHLGISLRQLERLFAQQVGLTPKTLCRIVRFQNMLQQVGRGGARCNWSDLALACGYYDQAHFNREFKHISGITPRVFAKANHPLAACFNGLASL